MNPWALVIVALAIALFVVAAKGTQDNVISALKGKTYGTSYLGAPGTNGMPVRPL